MKALGLALVEVRRVCLVPLMKLWIRSMGPTLAQLPHADDSTQAHTVGTNCDRVLIFGSGAAVGWGVTSHELALPGSLAKALSSFTDRGTDVDNICAGDLDASNALRTIENVQLGRYDSIVVVLGANEAVRLMSPDEWRTDMAALLEWIADATTSGIQIIVAGIPPLRSNPIMDSWLGSIADRHAAALNEITAEVCAHSTRTIFVPLTVPFGYQSDSHRSPSGYAQWARMMAAAMAPGFVDPRHYVGEPSEPHRTVHHDYALAEDRRQRAVDKLALVDSATNLRLDRLVFAAKQGLGTETAVFSVLDHERTWNKSIAGNDLAEIPRSESFSDETIRKNGGMIVLDASTDPRFHDNPLVVGDSKIRFYAGFPVESPAGERVGALCVLDSEPRKEGEFNLSLLRELALLAQRELWRYLYEKPIATPA
jgi:lysophospholipase L1-like esterase